MYQLRALIWKSYKVRVRSPFSTALDLLGPLVIILLYIIFKVFLNLATVPLIEPETKDLKLLRDIPEPPLDIRRALKSQICPKVLYYSTGGEQSASIESTLRDECGFELTKAPDRLSLLESLRRSLDLRIVYQRKGFDLNMNNSNDDNCIELTQTGGGFVYQFGLVHSGNNIEIHSTDYGGSSVIHMPYSQGSPYNEYKLPQSDLNLGTHLIEICIGKAFTKLVKRVSLLSLRASNGSNSDDISWRFKPYPVVTGIYVLPISTCIAVMIGCFCTNIATVIRISEANELGIHRYIRVAGLPACYYWLGLQTIVLVQALFQSLLTSMILAIPTGSYLSDPISEASMTLRWLLIFTYSLASNSHATFIASLFDRNGQALLALCSLVSIYAMYPLILLLQWSPYGFTSFYPLNYIALCNPVATFQAICQVIVAVALQTNQAFSWTHIWDRIINGGMVRQSTCELLVFLALQCLFWTLLTILIDQYRFCTATNIFGFLCSFVNEICCSNCCCAPPDNNLLTEDLKTKTVTSLAAPLSRLDPNRICCALRHVNVRGTTILMPYTKGNPLKFSHAQLRALRVEREEARPISKTTQYLINRKRQQHGESYTKAREDPILIDEAIKQNIVWYSTEIKFENLVLDFRFNQITFVLGQPNLKELLFECVLGLRALQSGHIIIDGMNFTSTTLNLARRQIGYLSERDIFYPDLSIFENLQFFGSLRQPSYKSFESESLFILNLLHMYGRRNNMPAYLTSRSARKLALGVASVGHTKLLLLTEPTANLHWRARCQVYNLLKKYKNIRSIAVDSSDVDEAVAFGDRLVLLKNNTTNLNDSPAQLEKKLACGYWLVFVPASGDGRSVNTEAIKSLERLTSDLFHEDKLDLDATKRSIYHKFKHNDQEREPGPGSGQTLSDGSGVRDLDKDDDDIHRVIIIVKVQHTIRSAQALCHMLRMFASQPSGINGFKLAHLSYESLEDILVLRMSRAIYPDLPPDLLLSLQHRTKAGQRRDDQSPISVRRLTSYTDTRSSSSGTTTGTSRSILSANMATIIKDRLGARSEIILTLAAFIGALIVILIALLAMQTSLGYDGFKEYRNFSNNNNNDADYQFNAAATTTRATATPPLPTSAQTRNGGGGDGADDYDGPNDVDNDNYDALTGASFLDTLLDVEARKEHSRGGGWSLGRYGERKLVHYKSLPFDLVERLYKYRVGLYKLERVAANDGGGGGADNASRAYDLRRWNGNKDFIGSLDLGRAEFRNQTDAEIVANLIRDSKDLASALVIYNPTTNEATVIFEPYMPHVMMAAIKKFIDYNLAPFAFNMTTRRRSATGRGNKGQILDSRREQIFWEDLNSPASSTWVTNDRDERPHVYTTSTFYFHHPWHEMIKGYANRRMIYGVGFAIAESLTMGALILAPTRHRGESHLARVQTGYWFSMAFFDMCFALILIAGYILLFIIIEGLNSGSLIGSMFIVLFLYKLASLPIPYTISIATETPINGFLFIFLLYLTISWDFAIVLRTFVEWTLITNKYLYTISNWLLFGLPITALIESLSIINQVNNINVRCRDVPAYTRTTNRVELEGVRRLAMIDDLLEKVRECLANGKTSINTNVLHQENLGILWFIYLIILFGLIGWTFLLTCERIFGIVARRFKSARTSVDPMKTIVRLSDNTNSLFKWDKERDRLISEYIKCMNELKYVKCMATNCLILRIWLKPMGDQASLDRRLSTLLEPLFAMGHTKNEIQVELRTTLQIFIRIGDEARRCRVDKIQMIETYTKFAEQHADSVAKIAVVDWTRENLYKIVLHGHYNTKIATAI